MRGLILCLGLGIALAAPLAAQTRPAASPTLRDFEGMLATTPDSDGRYGSLYTRPVATNFPGLCQRDEVRINYAPARTGIPPRPVSVESYRQYRVVRDRLEFSDAGYTADRFSAECTQFGAVQDAGWFSAWWERDAARGYTALAVALDRIRAGTLKIDGCDDDDNTKRQCEALLQPALRDRLIRLVDCSENHGRCYDINLYEGRVIVKLADEAYPVTPDKIESIELVGSPPPIV